MQSPKTLSKPIPLPSHGALAALVQLIGFGFLLTTLLAPRLAAAQSLKLSVDSDAIYAELPFTLSITAEGFEESPQPQISTPEIPGAQVDFLNVRPRISSMTSIINGRMSQERKVTFIFNYKVKVPSAGEYQVGSVTAVQGTHSAQTSPASFTASSVDSTTDMQLRLNLPERKLSVGETVEAELSWFLRKDVSGQNFIVPLFEMGSTVEIEAPPAEPSTPLLKIEAGGATLNLPYQAEKAMLDGLQYTRYDIKFLLTPIRPGEHEIPPTTVVAGLASGSSKGYWGRRRDTKLFKASDKTRTLSVRPLPVYGRPDSFAGAVGSAYSITVRADRTVVAVGEPITLTIDIKGKGALEGLTLPKLDGSDGLDPKLFSILDTSPSGQILSLEDGTQAKRFEVRVRLKQAQAREIPAIPFSFYDPANDGFHTVRSAPIALSVAGAERVDASDVIDATGQPKDSTRPAKKAAPEHSPSLLGVDMSLSNEQDTLKPATRLESLYPALLGIYIAPLMLLAFFFWRRSQDSNRAHKLELNQTRRALKDAIDKARTQKASESAAELINAARKQLQTFAERGAQHQKTITKLETIAFDPRCQEDPLPKDLLDQLEADLCKTSPSSRTPSSLNKIALFLSLGATLASPAAAFTQESDAQLKRARDHYHQALTTEEPAKRAALFKQAQQDYALLSQDYPDSPELLTDWGNAALGAQDLGTAALAYRRALAIEAQNERALNNLNWIRETLPATFSSPANRNATRDSFFFLNETLSKAERAILAALFFALAILLFTPWTTRSIHRPLRFGALFPIIIWLWLSASLFTQKAPTDALVVLSENAFLRSADSPGAAPLFASPLPPGLEVEIIEARGDWLKVRLSDDKEGWMKRSAAAPVIPAKNQ